MAAEPRDISDIVRIAVGFSTDAERSRWRVQPPAWARKGAFKFEPHQHSTPWQLVLKYTRKAIAKEDGHGKNYSRGGEEMSELLELQHSRAGMEPWLDWYHDRDGVRFDIESEELRQVIDIVRHTDDLAQATAWLGKKARDGWNKNHKQIVILNGREPVVDTDWTTAHMRWSFGPIGTAWLAAMAPRMNYRYLVIQYGIQQLMQFYNDDDIATPTFTGSVKRQELMREWYAFHTLRRMFRLRFGCSMTNCEEIAGPLDTFKPSKDAAWNKYKKGVKETLDDLAAKQAE